jgi:hypothetical protein
MAAVFGALFMTSLHILLGELSDSSCR